MDAIVQLTYRFLFRFPPACYFLFTLNSRHSPLIWTPETGQYLPWKYSDKRSLLLGQRYSINCIAIVHILGMLVLHGIWPRRPWCWVEGLSDVTVITWKHMQVMQQSSTHNSSTQVLYEIWDFSIRLGGRESGKMKGEPDLSLVRDQGARRVVGKIRTLTKFRNPCK